MITVILLDLYGVLRPDIYESWLKTHGLQRQGYYQTLSEQLDTQKLQPQEFFAALASFSGSTINDIQGYFNSRASIPAETFKYLDLLQEKYRLGLISNGSIHTRTMLQETGLAPYFEAIIISAEVGITKPSPSIYTKALEALAIKPEDALFVDDNPTNVVGAQQCGIRATQFLGFEQLLAQLDNLHTVAPS